MKKLKDYETRRGKSRHIEVKILCEQCGKEKWVRWIRAKNGLGKFCKMSCFNDYQREEGKKTHGRDKAKFHWDKSRNTWLAYWQDKDTGKRKNTTKARWLWENNNGEIPPKVVVAYIDGNPENCELDNLKLISRSEFNSISLMGHKVTNEAKAKMSKAHTGKVLSDEHKQKIRNWTQSKWDDGTFGSDDHLSKLKGKTAWNEGISMSDETKKKMSNSQIKRFEDPKEIEKHRESLLRGSDHPNWRGGVLEQRYPPEFSKVLRRKVRTRDRHECRLCPESAKGVDGRVHHIDADKHNNEMDNLLLLCNSCHGAIHAKYKTTNPVILAFRSSLYKG